MKCHECIEKLSAYSDHILAPEEQIEMEKHLENCPSCKEELMFLTYILEGMSQFEEVEVPSTFHQSMMEKIYEEKSNKPFQKNKLVEKPWIRYMASAAAALFIVVVLVNQIPFLEKNTSSSLKMEALTEALPEEGSKGGGEARLFDAALVQEDQGAQDGLTGYALPETPEQAESKIALQEVTVPEEVWEITYVSQTEILETIKEYAKTYELEISYLPDETNPKTLILYEMNDKDELFNKIMEINKDIQIIRNEGEGAHLEIIIK